MKNTVPKSISLELTVGEVAKRSGVAISTLHYYESEGLISSWRRAEGSSLTLSIRPNRLQCRPLINAILIPCNSGWARQMPL